MKKILIFAIKFYRKHISPHKKPCCRYTPTCSLYAISAIEKHGALLGSIMAVARILRCNPYCRPGYDPVGEKFTLKSRVGEFIEPSFCSGCEKKENCDGECSRL